MSFHMEMLIIQRVGAMYIHMALPAGVKLSRIHSQLTRRQW